ncbi:MAG: hypothetical protein PHS02_01480 [Candidatus ainarchaeum sp.]|nr:hypothetical protein [Candidatus ainarchaeum sp.]
MGGDNNKFVTSVPQQRAGTSIVGVSAKTVRPLGSTNPRELARMLESSTLKTRLDAVETVGENPRALVCIIRHFASADAAVTKAAIVKLAPMLDKLIAHNDVDALKYLGMCSNDVVHAKCVVAGTFATAYLGERLDELKYAAIENWKVDRDAIINAAMELGRIVNALASIVEHPANEDARKAADAALASMVITYSTPVKSGIAVWVETPDFSEDRMITIAYKALHENVFLLDRLIADSKDGVIIEDAVAALRDDKIGSRPNKYSGYACALASFIKRSENEIATKAAIAALIKMISGLSIIDVVLHADATRTSSFPCSGDIGSRVRVLRENVALLKDIIAACSDTTPATQDGSPQESASFETELAEAQMHGV